MQKSASSPSAKPLGAIRQNTLEPMTLRLINPKYYVSKLRDILVFAVFPRIELFDKRTTLQKITDLFVIFVITLVLSLTAVFIVKSLIDPLPPSKLTDYKEKLGATKFFFVAVLLMPLVEESCFRLPLKFSPKFLSISFLIISYWFISRHVFNTRAYDLEVNPIVRISLAIISAGMFFLFIQIPKINFLLDRFWLDHFRWIFYISWITFAFGHIKNFEENSYQLIMIPLLTLSQLVGGLALSYTRITYGFAYGLILHGLMNSIVILIVSYTDV